MIRETEARTIPAIMALVMCAAGLVVSAFAFTYLDRSLQSARTNAPAAFSTDAVPFGINASIEEDDPATQLQKLQIIRDGGFHWVRQPFPWREIEPAKGFFQWEKWDRLVDHYSQYGLEVVAVLDRPPPWSRQDNNWANRPPDNYDDFGDFVHAFVSHFRGRVRYVQIWDEPNSFPNWGNQAVDPAAYATLLKVSHTRAKTADPTIELLSAGLAPNLEKGGRNMSDVLFLGQMYRHGAGQHFDILAVKPYGLWSPPEDRRADDDVLNFSRVVRHREISVQNGYGDKPVWAVEFGWNALPSDWKGGPSIWGSTSEDSQASYTYQAYSRATREWPWLQVLMLQGMLPQRFPSDPLYGFSIVDSRLEPRPVYRAVKYLASTPTAGAGDHAAKSPFVSYSGVWPSRGSTRVGAAGDSLEIRFSGTRLDLQLWKTSAGGTLEIGVDGQVASRSPQLSGEGTLDLYASTDRLASIVAASGLSDEEHTVRLWLADDPSRKAELRFEGFAVRREANEPWLPLLGALWAVWTGGALWAIARLCWQWRGATRRALVGGRLAFDRAGDVPAGGVLALALALLYFAPGIPASLAMLAALAALVYYRLEIGLLFVTVLAPFYLRPKAFGGLEFSLVEILILACALAYAVRWMVARKYRRASEPNMALSNINWHSDLPILLFLLAGVISLTVTTVPRESLRELRTVVVEPVIYYYLLVSTLRGRRRATDIAHALVLAGVAISLVGLYQYAFTDDVITAEGVRRMRGFYGSPNNLGLFLGRAIPITLCLAWLAGQHRKRYLGALSVMSVALFLTFSIGAWAAVALSALFVAAFAGRRAMAWTVASAAAGGLALVPILRIERISSHLNLQESTTSLRLHIWQAALNMVRDNPIGGIGLDNFLYRYPNYRLPEAWREPYLSHPHNLVLDFWLRLGSPGLLVITWLLYGFFSRSARLYRRLGDSTARALVIGASASMIDFVLHGLIDNSYFVVDLAIIFWATLGVLKTLEQEGESA